MGQLDFKQLVDKCLDLELKDKIPELQDNLYKLYSYINKPGGGTYITNFTQKENLALCFTFMLKYDWVHDNEVREVWAENAFYCITDYLHHQKHGMQGQIEGMMILYSLLCVGRKSLETKFQDILNKGQALGNPIFHEDDYKIGAKNVIEQISLLALSNLRQMGQEIIPMMAVITKKFDGIEFFESTIKKTYLMKYNPMDIFEKMKFIKDVIGSILQSM